MPRKLVDWCRAAWQRKMNESAGWRDARDWWRRAFCPRHVGAGATSLGIHAAAVLAIIWMSADQVFNGSPPGIDAQGKQVAVIPMAFGQITPAVPRRAERPAVKRIIDPGEGGPSDVGIRMRADASRLAFGNFDFDVAKLTSRAGDLFPFLTRRLSFQLASKPPRRSPRSLLNPYADAPVETNISGPLLLSDAEVQEIVDQTWSRRERWTPFQRIRTLAETYNPDDGQVSVLLREYGQQNVLQPYVESTMRDQRIWSQLALAADHAYFIEFVDRYAAEHPATKATMELLFVMDMLTEASLDTLLAMLGVEPGRHLQWTRKTNPDAYKAFVTIQDFYLLQRQQRALGSHKALLQHYDQLRINILTSIIRSSPDGYRESDARYLIGEILWREGRLAEARETWRGMRVDAENTYVRNATDILALIRDLDVRREEAKQLAATDRDGRPIPLPDLEPYRVNRILGNERDRWLEFSKDRLKRFGYAPDSF